ncbi:hypothetical protein [Streptomyces sp. JV178]|uniref:hypothetical protein n=1 Tax=Streptomyces sp. JV178 TaxID=858632 RepID=UPI00211F1AF9|nr:hypothetical protein [Streptomyces sp. JV178]
MLVDEAEFTVDLGESGYLIGFTEHDDYPEETPYGWRCGPAGASSAVVLTTTENGQLLLTLQIHDAQPAFEPNGSWEPAEEISLLTENSRIHLATLDPADIADAWPDDRPILRMPLPSAQHSSIRMRLYCHADDPEPGVGDHGERHLIQFWQAPATDPVHPALSEEDRQARAEYKETRIGSVQEYTIDLPLQSAIQAAVRAIKPVRVSPGRLSGGSANTRRAQRA